MKIQRIEHVGVVVDDLPAAKAFFLDFGLEVQGEGDGEGELLDQVVGLYDAKTAFVMIGTPDGQAYIELVKFYTPSDEKGFSNLLQIPWVYGILHLLLKILKRLLPN
jgi:catechol 2,3-dioxygenase-like lactoylglutathione lyase family enzyme